MNMLKILRETKHLSQDDLAQAIGVSVATVSRWESEEFSPRTEKLPQIAKALDCKIDDLFSEKEC